MDITKTIIQYIQNEQNIILSGGAPGADTLFGRYAILNNMSLIHFSFKNHNTKENYLIELPKDMLETPIVINALKKANITLRRKIPSIGSYVYNLLARNYYQIFISDSVYAITEVLSSTELSGGTAWATQMYINLCKDNNRKINLYVYCPKKYKLFKFCNSTNQYIEATECPYPSGICTGIGSRKATYIHMREFQKYFR